MVSVTETLAAKLDGHRDFLIVVPDSAAWPKLEPDEAAMIIMPNLYKIYISCGEHIWVSGSMQR